MSMKRRPVLCREAIQEVFADEEGVLSADQIIERVLALYPDRNWKASTIQAQLIGLTVNPPNGDSLRSAQHVWLYSLGDGRYRRWHPGQAAHEEAAPAETAVAENDGQTEDSPQTLDKVRGPSDTETILKRLDSMSRQLAGEGSYAVVSSRWRRDIGLFVMGIAIVLSITFAALARHASGLVYAAVASFFLSGVMAYASGSLAETALRDSPELADKINQIGGSAFPFDKTAMMRWNVSESSGRFRVSLVCGVLIYVGLALTALLVVLALTRT